MSAPVADNAPPTVRSGPVDPDHDDHITEKYGHAASAADRRAIVVLVRRYYAVATAGDGAQACSMLLGSIVRSVPADYGQSGDLQGTSCASVLSKLFVREHRTLMGETPSLAITKVRLHGNEGLAILSFATTPEPREISVSLEGSAWKMASLIDASLP